MSDQCKVCGSYAINPHLHGREKGRDLDLCDVCYWRKRYTLKRMSASDEKENRITNEQVWLQLFAAYIQGHNIEIGAAYHAELADAAFYQWQLRFGRK